MQQIPVTHLKGVGAKFAKTLSKLGIFTLQDLLFHLPFRYVDRSRIRSIASLKLYDMALIQARVCQSKITFGKRRSLIVKLEDDSGLLQMRFFHFSSAQKNNLYEGRLIRVFGEVRPGPNGPELYHPEYDFIDDDGAKSPPEDSLTPVYSLTDGVSQPRLRSLSKQVVDLLDEYKVDELLPDSINEHFGVSNLSEALKFIHFPPSNVDQGELLAGHHPYQQRLAFEELLAHFLAHRNIRKRAKAYTAPEIRARDSVRESFIKQLTFTPTSAQMRVSNEITTDMQNPSPMLRMVQGDVGSGKTLVAALAGLNCITSGHQVAIVAPTEILAEQHRASFGQWFAPMNIKIDLLVGKLSAKQKEHVYARLKSGETGLVVGTHALFQDHVSFARLGLVIIDEQHRFGVHQRLSLRDKSSDGLVPHQLVMTATPIPRSLAMTAFSDLDFSIIDELPAGRLPIETALVSQNRKEDVIERMLKVVDEGRQIYWVCPLIEQSESLSVANAEETFLELQKALPNLNIALVHGRLNSEQKQGIMRDFKTGSFDVLVATTVIEVGVDVPNASVMIIENPERLGLAQLHQLRGRVGRGSIQSHCILLYGESLSAQGKERLRIMRQTNDGFLIAEKDLQMRGPGEFLGTRQAGDLSYRVADSERDAELIDQVHSLGTRLEENDPALSRALIERWLNDRQLYALA